MRNWLLPILLLICLISSSCIEIKEEIWINEDSSGRVEATITGPSLLLSKYGQPEDILERLKKQIDAEPGIEITSSSVTRIAAETEISIEMTFEDGRKAIEFMNSISESIEFEKLPSPLVEKVLIGKLDLTLDFPSYHFTRTLDFRQFNTTEMTPTFARTPLADATFESTIHLPAKPFNHNAAMVSDNGKILHWNIPLIYLLEDNKELSYSARIPLIYELVLTFLTLSIILAGLTIKWYFMRKKAISKA